jgi:hypothetical protein
MAHNSGKTIYFTIGFSILTLFVIGKVRRCQRRLLLIFYFETNKLSTAACARLGKGLVFEHVQSPMDYDFFNL